LLVRPSRLAPIVVVLIAVLAAVLAASVNAATRMPVGFFDDPSFRWAQRPTVNLSSAQKAHASIIHVLADWSQIAKTKPASPLNGDDPAYDLSDLDAIVETAPRYNMQILMTISGTPKWANGGKTPNVPPTNLGNLTQFAHMLAARYNGLRPGFGAVSRWSIWNEPNLELFLKPQFQGSRRRRTAAATSHSPASAARSRPRRSRTSFRGPIRAFRSRPGRPTPTRPIRGCHRTRRSPTRT
jgi:hypothetical protein